MAQSHTTENNAMAQIHATTDNAQSAGYLKAGLENSYDLHPGVFALPVAENPPTDPEERESWSPVIIVTAHAPYRIRNVRFASKKDTNPPFFPSPTNIGPYVFLGGTVEVPFPQTNTAGKPVWSIGGDYIFIEAMYANSDTGYIIGNMPFIYSNQLDNRPFAGSTDQPVLNASGLGPQAGYRLSSQLDLTSSNWLYQEVSYIPGRLQSNQMLIGSTFYPNDLST